MARPNFGGRGGHALRQLLARHPDWHIAPAGSGHWKATAPTGAIVILPGTFFDGPMVRRLRAQLRRAARTGK